MKWTRARKAVLIVVGAILGAGTLAISWTVISFMSALLPDGGAFDRPRFEAVVAEVRRMPIPAGQQVRLRLADLQDPRSLRPADDEPLVRGGGAGLVWAERTGDGKLKVVIETRDAGHAGEYGFAYSEAPLKTTPLDANWSMVDVPGRLTILGSRIDEHWWSVLFNLD